jgi:fructose-1-phosphate kinase PfkB-like protein
MGSERILIVGLNPALQRTVTLPSLTVGTVNRGSSVEIGIGGKGQNLLVASSFQIPDLNLDVQFPNLRLIQFLGSSYEGKALEKMLEDVGGPNALITHHFQGRCRSAITLIDSGKTNGEATEIVEPSQRMSQEDIIAILDKAKEAYPMGAKVRAVAVMGSMPSGCPIGLYGEIIKVTCDENSIVLLDTTVGLPECFQQCSNVGCQVLLKVNARELCAISHLQRGASSEAEEPTPVDLIRLGARHLFEKFPNLSGIAVTDGAFPGYLLTNDSRCWSFSLPPLPSPPVNPIGAGDTVASGTLLRLATGAPLHECFAWGLACGAASCLTNSCATFEVGMAETLFPLISTTELTFTI